MKLVILFLVITLAASPVYSAITIQQAKLGDLFLTTETPSLPITATLGTTVDWKVKDYFGNPISNGSVALVAKKATILPPGNKPGWYELEMKEMNGAALVSTVLTSFAIVTPIDITTMQESPFGVTSHFAQFQNPACLPLMKRAGVVQVKDEHYWASTELTQGAYTFGAKYAGYLAAEATNGLVPLMPLTWGNKFYDYEGGGYTAPHTDNGRLGFANFGKALVDHYPNVRVVEPWNEYNAGTFIVGPATADKDLYYKKMLQKVWETIKPTHPDCKVVGPATVIVAHGFLKALFQQGALPFLDAVSVHPYMTPDYVPLEFGDLHELIKQFNGGVDKPIWATEFAMLGVKSDAGRYAQAPYVTQIATLMLTQNTQRMYYYFIHDDSTFPFNGLVGAGSDTTRGSFRPHPVFIAYSNLIRQLYGATYQSRFPTPASIYAFKFVKGGQPVNVLWSNRPVKVSLVSSGALTVVDIMGGIKPGTATLDLTGDVQYVLGNVTSVTPINNDLLADSVSGYSKIAGQNGWSYGYAIMWPTPVPYTPSLFKPATWQIWGTDNYRWVSPTSIFASGSAMNPSGHWSIRRWTSNYAGPATLEGKILHGSASGDGVGVKIFVDGTQVYSQNFAPKGGADYSVPATLSVGSKVDFTLNCNVNANFDTTSFNSQVIKRGVAPQAPTNLRIVNPLTVRQ